MLSKDNLPEHVEPLPIITLDPRKLGKIRKTGSQISKNKPTLNKKHSKKK